MRGGVVWDMSSTCVQGGLPRPLGGYQPNLIMEPRSPAPAWQLHHPVIPKQEPMEEDRNDSGINSGSDFHSSSPGSENSQDYNPAATYSSSQNTQNPPTSTYYSTPLISRIPTSSPTGYGTNTPLHLGYQPITPPSSKNLQVPQQDINFNTNFINKEKTISSSSPEHPQVESSEHEDPLRRLQCAFERNGLISAPASSPKTSEHSVDDDNKSEEEFDEQGLRIPKMNSHGKVKTFKCKQCNFVAITKLDFWEHSKEHIKAEKLLTCPKCPFVTEYKHHLEYHLRNHFGSKPFKCDQCPYSCVNKSMLNSHMKSHSAVYQYHCADCSYATKYCHSLKLHLRKYGHKPDMVLNADGTPNPLPIIDVYGTRRGPKQRPMQKTEATDSPSNSLHNQFAHFMLNASPQMQMPFPYHLLSGFPNPMANPLLFASNLMNQRANSPEQTVDPEPAQPQQESPKSTPFDDQQIPQVLDLSKPESSPAGQPTKNRRKGRAFKLENLRITESSDEEDLSEKTTEEKKTVTSPKHSPAPERTEVTTNSNNYNNTMCQYCDISFGDIVLYTMHMGYHGFKDPFTCNMCGEQCHDKVSFFLHIARNPHL